MITKFDDNDSKMKIITQQYQIGTYVAVYKDGKMVDQGTSELSEEKFHEKLRKNLNKKNIKWQ